MTARKQQLTVSPQLSLPLSAVTEVISVLATRGAGKSFGSADFAEEFYGAGLQFVVVDPMGVYWGLRSSYDGKREGLGVIVLGGERADVPLEPTSGRLIADVVVDSGQSFVLDLSLFDSKAEQVKFMEAFAERIFYRKGPIEARTPLMLIVDEADEFAPQKPNADETRMLGHMIRLAKRGRTRGIGLLVLTQRSAEFSKAILDLSSAVVFMRTAGPRDRKAIKDWLKGSAPELLELVDARFPKLDTGEALVYSPHWLRLEEPLELKFRMIETFDSYRTPEPGETQPAPARVAPVDLERLGEQIAATVERARENDPQELRAKIRRLERAHPDVAAVEAERDRALTQADDARQEAHRLAEAIYDLEQQLAQRPPLAEDQVERLATVARELRDVAARVGEAADPITRELSRLTTSLRAAPPPRPSPPVARAQLGLRDLPAQAPPARTRPARRPDAGEDIAPVSGTEQRVLDGLAWWRAVGVDEPSLAQLAFACGYHERTKTFTNALGSLNTKGLIERLAQKRLRASAEGELLGRPPAATPSNRELHALIYRQIGPGLAKVLEPIIGRGQIARAELAAMLGYHERTKTFTNALGRLHSLGLAEHAGAGVERATDLVYLTSPIS